MPRKEQGWITFQTSEEERKILEEICQASQRTKTEVLRELVRGLRYSSPPIMNPTEAEEAKPVAPSKPDRNQPAAKKPLKVSSRNILKGRVTRVIHGSVNTEVTLEIVHPIELTSVITTASAEALELAEGTDAYAVIKSSDVVIAMD